MKKVILLILLSICYFLFISCNMSKLEAPVNVKIENNVCTWNIVGNASQYQIIIDNDVYSSFSNKYDLSEANLIAGKTYSVRIKAISGSIFIQSSDYSEAIEFEYISSTNKEISSVTSLFDIGLTYGVNAIKDESVSNGLSTKNSNIFDLDKLSNSDIGKNQILLSKGNTNSSENIKEVIKECNVDLVFGQNTDIDILSGMFTLGYEKKFKLDVVSKHNQRKYQYYYVQKQYINSYNFQIKNYQLRDELSKKLSKSFINSILEIKESDDNFVDLIENLFNTYGTHVVMSISYGAMSEIYYGKVSNKEISETDITGSLDRGISGKIPFEGIDFSKNNEISSTVVTSGKNSTETCAETLNVYFTGGKAINSATLKSTSEKYNEWIDSIDGKEVVIDAAKNGLVPIWYYIPKEYSDVRNKIEGYFNEKARENTSNLKELLEYTDEGDKINYDGGHGTVNEPYIISNVNHLKNISKNMGSYYLLKKDIIIDNENWTPIGTYKWKAKTFPSNPFIGTLDGGNHTIKFKIDVKGFSGDFDYNYSYGLFGSIKDATIKNLNIESTIKTIDEELKDPWDISDGPESPIAGSIAGWGKNSKIENCKANVTNVLLFKGNRNEGCTRVGGLLGSSIKCKFSNCEIKGIVNSYGYNAASGGIVGTTTNTDCFENCNTSNIKCKSGHIYFFGTNHDGLSYGSVDSNLENR
mgnify:FL=1